MRFLYSAQVSRRPRACFQWTAPRRILAIPSRAGGNTKSTIDLPENERKLMKMNFSLKSAAALLAAASIVSPAFANEGAIPKGIPHLDHVFVIMMENHAYAQIVGNPNAPFTNQYLKSVNTARNYFAIAHPSLTNYLETVGGSNFGVLNDNSPDWHNTNCLTNLSTGKPSLDDGTFPAICPIYGTGTDAATPAIDFSNETSGPPGDINIDGVKSIPADSNIAGKHNPFSYFQSVQEGLDSRNSLKNMVGFSGANGLFADLGSGHVPTFSFIAPNQCNAQHGRGNAGP